MTAPATAAPASAALTSAALTSAALTSAALSLPAEHPIEACEQNAPRVRRDQLPPIPDRDLSARELKAWVDAFAPRTHLWEGAVAHGGGRHYSSLYRDRHLDVWLLCWNVEDDTGWHDHDISSGAVAVTRGVITEGRLRFGLPSVRKRVTAGRSFCFGPERIHSVSGAVDGAVSIHAYSPPLVRLGQYTMTRAGVLQRVSVGYEEELRAGR